MEVTLGTRQVVPGFEQGLTGMCVGEKRKVSIPPDLAYGSKGVPGTIPPRSTLIFTLELMSLSRPPLVGDILPFLQTISPIIAATLIAFFIYKKATESDRVKVKGEVKTKNRRTKQK